MNEANKEPPASRRAGRGALLAAAILFLVLVANIVVARIILSPAMKISPSLVVFHGCQKTDLGKALYANSITLTPGTITTGVEGNEFQIHALTAADLETDEEDQMDHRCAKVEGLL